MADALEEIDDSNTDLNLNGLFGLNQQPIQFFDTYHEELWRRFESSTEYVTQNKQRFISNPPTNRSQEKDLKLRAYDYFPNEDVASSAFFETKDHPESNDQRSELWAIWKESMLDPINFTLHKQGDADEIGFAITADDFRSTAHHSTKPLPCKVNQTKMTRSS